MLVERIINKVINDGIDIDKLLIVTFTNAAASEMRQRVLDAIYKRLEEEPQNQILQRQINLLNRSSICTIDSFCLEVIKNNFYELDNLSPNFRIADTTEIELLKQEVLEDIFDKKYELDDNNFSCLINTYTSYKDDTPLKNLVLNIYSYIQSNPFPKKWLSQKIEMFNIKEYSNRDFALTPWGKELLKQVDEELVDAINSLEEVLKDFVYDKELENFAKTIRSDINNLRELKNNLDNWDRAYMINQNLTFVTWPRQKVESIKKDIAKQVRDDVKKKLKKVLDKILIYDSRQANQDIYDMYDILLKLEELILEFDKEYIKRKRERNIVDFNDIEHFALDILLKEDNGKIIPTEVAKKYQEKYQEIAIDEYQDSNLVQEYILTAVSRSNNIFMVGDVKQSIYKFRQAMPELFLDKYDKYKTVDNKKENNGLKIQLFKNFRSKKKILDFTNIIFQNIMSEELGDIEYNQEEYLNLGANYPESENQNSNIQINIIDLADKESEEFSNNEENKEENITEIQRIEDVEIEAKFVAKEIKKLIDEKFQIWDKNKEMYRNIRYSDVVILLRTTSNTAPIYEQEILNLEMPVFSDSSQQYLDSIEIQTIMSLLKIIDNPIQDIPLVTVLRSAIGKFTDDELVQIRLSDKYDDFYTCMQKSMVDVDETLKEKISSFFESLDIWRKEQEYLSLDELIWKIYMDTGFYNYVGLMPNGELRQANLKMLFQKAKQYENSNFKGLYNFINFIDKLALSSGDLGSVKLIGENDDVVRIMSIHKSKGLEFPVVFLANCSKQFNLMDLNQNVLLHQQMGIGVKYIDYEKQIQYDTLSKAAIKNKILVETLSEEMRILYVALTRAKEKLIITGVYKDYEKEMEKMFKQLERYKKTNNKINPILVKKYKKYMDWILLVYHYESKKAKDIVDFNVYKKDELLKKLTLEQKEKVDVISLLEKNKLNKIDKESVEKLKKLEKILNYKYPYEQETKITTTASVTSIKEMENQNLSTEKNQLPKPEFLRSLDEEKLTGAQKGTLVHLCLQKLNPKVDYNLSKIKDLIQDLENKKIITKKEMQNINPYKILEFTKSEIWNELKSAKKVCKEQPFYISLPAKEVYKENLKEDVLVQGIIDLYYINKDNQLILVDYKTDYIEEGKYNELILKYKKQLELYQKALELALEKKVDRKYIYSVYLGKTIEIY